MKAGRKHTICRRPRASWRHMQMDLSCYVTDVPAAPLIVLDIEGLEADGLHGVLIMTLLEEDQRRWRVVDDGVVEIESKPCSTRAHIFLGSISDTIYILFLFCLFF